MHSSSSSPSRFKTDSTSVAVINFYLGLTTFVALLITVLSCFATSWVSNMLSQWPEGSVMRTRRSGLHSCFPRCADDVYESVLAGGDIEGGAKEGSYVAVTKKTAKILDQVEQLVNSAVVQLSKQKQQQQQQKEGGAQNTNREQFVHALREDLVAPATWAAPPYAIRAATVDRHKNLLPNYYAAENRRQRAVEKQNVQMTSVPAVSSSAQRVMGISRMMADESRENATYARNTVDKLIYQLSNFEPLKHRGLEHRRKRQWNPVVGLLSDGQLNDAVQKQLQQQHKQSPASCPVKQRKRLTVGLSSVSRRTNYLHSTITALIDSVKHSGWIDDITIVLLDADVPPGKNMDVVMVKSGFKKYIRSGALRIVTRGEHARLPHPEMRGGVQRLKHRWGDPDSRILWRTKQVLDVAWLMDYVASKSVALSLRTDDLRRLLNEVHRGEHHAAVQDVGSVDLPTDEFIVDPPAAGAEEYYDSQEQQQQQHGSSSSSSLLRSLRDESVCPPLGGYFLMLEDDIDVTRNFMPKVTEWLKRSRMSRDTGWTVASFYNPWPVRDGERLPPFKFFGVIGQLFRLHDLPIIVEFLRKNPSDSPLDWLFVDILKKFGGEMVCSSPSLFQHKGVVSSLEGKEQDGRAVDFVP